MADRIRVIVDTNTFVSAAIFDSSVPRQVINKVKSIGIILISPQTTEELYSVFSREKFNKYLTRSERAQFLQSVLDEVESVVTTSHITDCRDPRDNKFLELAVDGNAQYIITGDDDLLQLSPYHGIKILTPAEFIKEMNEGKD
jgi:putative PIN family toxin of toxin-antitoxin system